MSGAPRKPAKTTNAQRERDAAADSELRVAVGERIVLIRMALGKTQAEFSRLLGVSPGVLSQQESGLYLPSIQYAIRIDKEAGCTLDFLFKGSIAAIPPALQDKMNRVPRGAKRPTR